jgi:hypothetical protein
MGFLGFVGYGLEFSHKSHASDFPVKTNKKALPEESGKAISL